MKFGRVNLGEAEGSYLAHTLKLDTLRMKKGHRLSAEDIAELRCHGCETVVSARLEEGDIDENQAATRVAAAVLGPNLKAQAAFTGRANLYVTEPGLLVYDRERLDQLNMVDEAVTLSALSPFTVVQARQIIATIKIIPYGVAATVVETVETIAQAPHGLFRVAPFRSTAVGLVQTKLPGIRDSVLNKTRLTLETRLARLGAQLVTERRCAHDELAIGEAIAELAAEGCRMILIIGASATADRRDLIPAGIERAGGRILHLGMPVEPGNLLLLAELPDDRPVIGLPGCARSPALNGVDWVFERLFAGLKLSGQDIMRMGAGGFIKGQQKLLARSSLPTAETPGDDSGDLSRMPKIAAIVLAAGMSRRMGSANKLLELIDGEAMVDRVTRRVAASQVDQVIVVTGHDADRVKASVSSDNITFVHNPDYAAGISTSLHCGLARLPADVDAALVCLADMPAVATSIMDQLIAAFNPGENRLICVPYHHGHRGNPVVLARRFFSEMHELTGDKGARDFLQRYTDLVCEVEVEDAAVLQDIDSPESLLNYREAQRDLAGPVGRR